MSEIDQPPTLKRFMSLCLFEESSMLFWPFKNRGKIYSMLTVRAAKCGYLNDAARMETQISSGED
jgi:hypothetical protein